MKKGILLFFLIAVSTCSYSQLTRLTEREYYELIKTRSQTQRGGGNNSVLAAPANDCIANAELMDNCGVSFNTTNYEATNGKTNGCGCKGDPQFGGIYNDLDCNIATGNSNGGDVNYSVENDIWYKFCPAVTGNWIFSLTASGCNLNNTGNGTLPGEEFQCSVFQGVSTNLGPLVAGGVQTQGSALNITINVTSLTDCFFIEIDGYSGIQCDFSASLTPPTTCTFANSFSVFAGADVTICSGSSATLTATPTGGTTPVTYSWSPATGLDATTGTSVTATPSATTTYTVIATDNSTPAPLTSTDYVVVTVNGPVLTVSPPAPEICNGDSVQLIGTITTGTTTTLDSSNFNTVTAIPNNDATGVTTSITVSGISPTTLGSSTLAFVCFTIDHTKQSDIGATGVILTSPAGDTYSFGTALSGNGVITYCFTTAVLATVTGNSNGVWSLTIKDTKGSGGGTGNINGWVIGFNNETSIGVQSFGWSPATDLSGTTILNPYASPTSTTTYTFSATDDNNCTSTIPVTVTVNPLPTAAISGGGTICTGASATINIALTGTAPWSVTYTDGTTPTTVTGIMTSPYTFATSNPATYTVTAVSDASCTGTQSGSATVTVNSDIVVSNINTTACVSGNYTVVFDITGGNSASYSVAPAASGTISGVGPFTFTSNDIASGTPYSFTVSDVFGCNTPVVSGSVNCSCTVTAVVSGGGTVCAGSAAPDVIFTFANGTGDYNLTYTDGTTPTTVSAITTSSYTISSPAAGVYSVTSIDDGSCTGSGSGSATVSFYPLPTAAVTGGGSICDDGFSTTTVNVALSGASPWDIVYAIDGAAQPVQTVNASPFVITTSTAGLYTVLSLSDANTCSGTTLNGSADVIVNSLPTANITGNNGPVCAGSDATFTLTGTIDAVVTYTINGGSNATATLTGGSATITVNSATADQTLSLVSIADANCSQTITGTSTVTVNALPTASIIGGGSFCAGNSAPDIGIEFTGTQPWTVVYNDGSSNVTVNNIVTSPLTLTNPATGTYTLVSVGDANCSNTATGNVDIVSNPLPTADINGGGTECSGTPVPDINIDLTGAQPWTVIYNDGTSNITSTNIATTPFIITNPVAGTYTIVSVTDANGCTNTGTGSATSTITPLDDATFDYIPSTICNLDANPSANITGGSSGIFTSLPATLVFTDNTTGTIDLASSPTGNFTITFTTNVICPNTSTFDITIISNPTDASFSYPASPYCAIGTVLPTLALGAGAGTFTSTAGLVFIDDQTGEIDLINSTPGTYTVTNTITGVGSCGGDIKTSDITINTIATATDIVATCDTYVWRDGNTYNTSNNTATFTVPAATVDGCDSVYTLNLTINNAVASTDIIAACDTYTWRDGVVYNSNNTTATFTVPAATADGCDSVYTLNLTINNAATSTDIITACNTYTWRDGVVYNSNNTTATFTVPAATVGGCDSVYTLNLTINPSVSATISGGGTICAGTAIPDVTIALTGAQPWTVVYNDGTSNITSSGNTTSPLTLSGLADGTYTLVSVTDANCSSTASGSVNITTSALPTATISGGGTVCTGTAIPDVNIVLTGAQPWTVVYNDGTSNITSSGNATSPLTLSGLADGTYTLVSVTDANCFNTASGSVNITTSALPTATISGGGTHCTGALAPDITIGFTGIQPWTVVYNNGTSNITSGGNATSPLTLSGLADGTYTLVSVTDASCSNTASGSVSITTTAPSVNANASSGTVCLGGSVTLTGSGTAVSYSWNNGVSDGVSFVPSLGTTTYTVTGTDLNGCSNTASTSVTVSTAPVLATSISADSICQGTSVSLTGGGASTYTWEPGTLTGSTVSVSPAVTTEYTLTGNTSGCMSTALVTVYVVNNVDAAFTYLPATPQTEDTITFTNATSVPLYEWSFGDGSPNSTASAPTHSYEVEGEYDVTLIVKDGKGCKDTMAVTIIIADTYNLIIPNIFTPNNDNSNDIFGFQKSKGLKEVNCQIFDRWGLQVFEFGGPKGGWDGRTQSGSECVAGVYYYIVKITSNTGENKEHHGSITLVR